MDWKVYDEEGEEIGVVRAPDHDNAERIAKSRYGTHVVLMDVRFVRLSDRARVLAGRDVVVHRMPSRKVPA